MATKKKTWNAMSVDEREAAVRRLMQEGGSNKSVAEELGTTPGAIAGLRRRKGIPSTNDAPDMGKPKEDTKPAPKPAAKAPKRVLPEGLEESKSEASRCEHRGAHCPYEAKVGSRFCLLHQDEETQARR